MLTIWRHRRQPKAKTPSPLVGEGKMSLRLTPMPSGREARSLAPQSNYAMIAASLTLSPFYD